MPKQTKKPRVVEAVHMHWALVEEQREMVNSMMRKRAQERDAPHKTACQEKQRREGEGE